MDFHRFLVAGFIYLSTDICCRTERRPGGKHDAGGTRPIRHDDVSGGRDRGKHTAKAAGKQKDKKAKPGGECLSGAVSFADAMARGLFSVESLHLMAERGFDVELAAITDALPIAGRTRACTDAWHLVTDSGWVLAVATEGYRIAWRDSLPATPHHSRNPSTDAGGAEILDQEVVAMIKKGAIEEVAPSMDEVVSGYFARPKRTPGKWRPIVSLKYTNAYIRKQPFRMTTPSDIRKWVRPGYFFTSIDLQDAYFSIGLHPSGRRFCRFRWRGRTYQYRCVMFGLGPSARVFTKTLKATLVFLRTRFGVLVVAYIDDILIQAPDELTCRLHTELTILLLQCLGFGVSFEKSSLEPATTVAHLGLIWDSVAMTVSLPEEKVAKIRSRAEELLAAGECTADALRSLLGTLESTRIVTAQAPLHYRFLQQVMPSYLAGGVFPGKRRLVFGAGARADLEWWATTAATPPHTVASLRPPAASRAFKTDASGLVGWGGHSTEGHYTQGTWSEEQQSWHINRKEIAAARLTLLELMEDGDRVTVGIDSTTAVAFINKMGGTRSLTLCKEALSLWRLVLERRGWVTAYWLPREENEQADMLSKTSVQYWDFGLQPEVAEQLWSRWFAPQVDLFASSTYHLTARYYSWFPDSGAARRDAFSELRWPDKSYAFPPVPLLPLTLEKVERDRIRTILVAPMWRAAAWWDTARALMVGQPMVLGPSHLILQPGAGARLPRLGSMMACLLDSSTSS